MVLIKQNDFIQYKFENKILLITILKAQPTDEEWEFTKDTIMGFYDVALLKEYTISLIFDLKELGMLDVTKIKEWAELFKTNRHKTLKVLRSSAMITDNTLFRITINMFLTMYRNSKPITIVSSYEEALEFINKNEYYA